jgi:hypothetical protein
VTRARTNPAVAAASQRMFPSPEAYRATLLQT